MADIPGTLAGVTAQWLTTQLHDAGHSLPAIKSLEHKPMDGFTGAMGEVGIFRVVWEEGDREDLPTTFVAKCPLDDVTARWYNTIMQFYIRESGFYSDLVQEIDMRVPKCWVNLFDPESGKAFLLLEHIFEAEKGDILLGCSIPVMEKLVSDLATMHGKFWMDDRLLEVPWLIDWRAESLQLGIEMTQTAWNTLAENEPNRYPKDLFEVLDQSWINNTVEWLGRYADRPWTLTHIDYELDNILIDQDDPIILDWQSIMRSHPGVDLGWLLAASHNQETLDAEPALLTLYRKKLAESGGPTWSAEELEEALAWGILYPASCQCVPYLQDVSAHGSGAERMHQRFDKFLQGSIDAAVRWNLVEHIGPLC